MAHPSFAPGSVLGERFELHGVVGRGGTAEVWLATDRLRGERVALKRVHPHLAADPETRRRLQREVQTASVLRSPAALVPYDLHEIDGVLTLSMPFHPGHTLAERVAASGKLDPEHVRALGSRIAEALADAHRAGVLHRDVTANNVLLGDRIEDSVLTDFGLSRILGSTRSTGLLGTAGFAAPEVYAGERADPRSDLYGLGAVLYLALTGRPAFDPRDPMAALKHQLEESQPKVRDLVPGCPPDLAALVDQLLRADPNDRPQGARDVADALLRRGGPEVRSAAGSATASATPTPTPTATATGRATPTPTATELPAGPYTVILHERSHDRQRRDRLRRQALGVAPSAEDQLARWGSTLVGKLGEVIGVPRGDGISPEQALHNAIAERAGCGPEALQPSRVLVDRAFRLVDRTDQHTATELANLATALGFRAEVTKVDGAELHRMYRVLGTVAIVAIWLGYGLLVRVLGPYAVVFAVCATVFLGMTMANQRRGVGEQELRRLAVAYPASLHGLVRGGVARRAGGRSAAGGATEDRPSAEPARATRGQALRDRALAAIDALESTAASGDLPDPARADLRDSAKRMRARATELGLDVDRIEHALVDLGDEADLAALRTRLDRMQALERAGERVDARERERITRALAEHQANHDAADRLESELAATTAALLELGSTASRVRRELLVAPEPRSADEIVARLSREARAAVEARREASARAARAAAERVGR